MSKESEALVLPSNPADRKKIHDMMHEIAGHFQFIDDRKAQVKEIIAALSEEHGLPKKTLAKMAKVVYKNNYSDEAHDNEVFETLYEGIIESNVGGHTNPPAPTGDGE